MKSVYPIGTTICRPDECSNGYNLIAAFQTAPLIDMRAGAESDTVWG